MDESELKARYEEQKRQARERQRRYAEKKEEMERQRNAASHRSSRSASSEETKREIREKNRAAHQELRGDQSEERKEEIKVQDRVAHQEFRADQSEERKEEVKSKHTASMQVSRANQSDEKKRKILQDDLSAHHHVRKEQKLQLPDFIRNRGVDAEAAVEFFWESARTFKPDDLDQPDPSGHLPFDPISFDEIKYCMNEYYEEVDPHSIMYGCAVCGLHVVMRKKGVPHSIKLDDLNILKISEVQIQRYLALPARYRPAVGVVVVQNVYLALHRRFLNCEPGISSETYACNS